MSFPGDAKSQKGVGVSPYVNVSTTTTAATGASFQRGGESIANRSPYTAKTTSVKQQEPVASSTPIRNVHTASTEHQSGVSMSDYAGKKAMNAHVTDTDRIVVQQVWSRVQREAVDPFITHLVEESVPPSIPTTTYYDLLFQTCQGAGIARTLLFRTCYVETLDSFLRSHLASKLQMAHDAWRKADDWGESLLYTFCCAWVAYRRLVQHLMKMLQQLDRTGAQRFGDSMGVDEPAVPIRFLGLQLFVKLVVHQVGRDVVTCAGRLLRLSDKSENQTMRLDTTLLTLTNMGNQFENAQLLALNPNAHSQTDEKLVVLLNGIFGEAHVKSLLNVPIPAHSTFQSNSHVGHGRMSSAMTDHHRIPPAQQIACPTCTVLVSAFAEVCHLCGHALGVPPLGSVPPMGNGLTAMTDRDRYEDDKRLVAEASSRDEKRDVYGSERVKRASDRLLGAGGPIRRLDTSSTAMSSATIQASMATGTPAATAMSEQRALTLERAQVVERMAAIDKKLASEHSPSATPVSTAAAAAPTSPVVSMTASPTAAPSVTVPKPSTSSSAVASAAGVGASGTVSPTPKPTLQEASVWVCTCTFRNNNYFKVCNMCDNPRA